MNLKQSSDVMVAARISDDIENVKGKFIPVICLGVIDHEQCSRPCWKN
jgi:hypothetical protein